MGESLVWWVKLSRIVFSSRRFLSGIDTPRIQWSSVLESSFVTPSLRDLVYVGFGISFLSSGVRSESRRWWRYIIEKTEILRQMQKQQNGAHHHEFSQYQQKKHHDQPSALRPNAFLPSVDKGPRDAASRDPVARSLLKRLLQLPFLSLVDPPLSPGGDFHLTTQGSLLFILLKQSPALSLFSDYVLGYLASSQLLLKLWWQVFSAIISICSLGQFSYRGSPGGERFTEPDVFFRVGY